MSRPLAFVLALVLCCGAFARGGQAEPVASGPVASGPFTPSLDSEYFWDGGAVPFIYVAGATALGLRLFVEPPSSPKLFPESEGGIQDFGNAVPEYIVTAYSLGFAGFIASVPKAERWHHLKGYGEAVLTTMALTEIAKNIVGRHRPHYQEGMEEEFDLRRSFFSGHASITAAGTVYVGLYLSRNLLPKPSLLKTVGVLALGGLLVGVPYSRVVDNRHHLSDVLTGGVVGGAVATAFYVYQQGRFADAQESSRARKRSQTQIVPNLRNPGLTLLHRW